MSPDPDPTPVEPKMPEWLEYVIGIGTVLIIMWLFWSFFAWISSD